ncbi:hypothetical protein HPB48_006711 [Haemaphysalis longicornis]|uniref:MBD domain-containing protein n=1 Tax=Haemaphysalis longicornis TaxID=44386 RepID=A0A9J6G5K6_HAELO|nr:hypothetical protein HPB48_006711 [Haemaphysalis longicornis]
MSNLECPALPKGWRREEVIRRTGLSAGKVDVYYYSPGGKKFRSKPQLARFLGDAIDLSTFDFRTGKINSLLLRKSRRQRGTQFDYSRGIRNDASLVPPIRQTASIFKQPVTVVRSQEGKVRSDFKHGPPDKPKQALNVTDEDIRRQEEQVHKPGRNSRKPCQICHSSRLIHPACTQKNPVMDGIFQRYRDDCVTRLNLIKAKIQSLQAS